MMASGSGAGPHPTGPGQQRQPRPYGVACLGCRRVKMRCITAEADDKCERCTRLRKDCVFETHRRGLWKRNRGSGGGVSQTTDRASLGNQQMVDQPLPSLSHLAGSSSDAAERPRTVVSSEVSMRRNSDRQHAFDAAQAPDNRSGGQFNPATIFTSNSARGSGALPGREEKEKGISFDVASFVTTDGDAGELAVDVALDNQRRMMEGDNSTRSLTSNDDREKSWKEQDPIQLNLLSRPAAEVLFECFMKHFNTLAGFLDPMLYTFSYTREASNLLFTACLSIAATVFRPELYRSLKDHQEMLLGKALLACDAAVENVWTMALLSYWKDVGDRRGYNLVGFAIQLAKSAEWNKMRRPMSLSQVEKSVPTREQMEVHVRQRRDKHLAWLLLGALDRTTSLFTSRPFTNPPITDLSTSRSWINSEPETYVWGCTRHVAGYELTAITRPIFEWVLQTNADSDHHHDDPTFGAAESLVELQKRMGTFNDAMDAWQTYWFPIVKEAAPVQQHSQVTFYGAYMKLYFNAILLHRMLMANGDNLDDPAAIHALNICHSSSMTVLLEARNFGKLDLLYYFWDSAHLVTAYAAMMLLKVLNLSSALPDDAASEALEVLTGLLVAYNNTAQAMAWRPVKQPGPIAPDKAPVANGLEAQVRLLRSIVATITSRFEVSDQASKASSATTLVSSAPTPPPWVQIEVPADSGVDAAARERGTEEQGEAPNQDGLSWTMAQLAGDMDFSLDSSFMDARFLDAGLLGWDEMGIFAVDK